MKKWLYLISLILFFCGEYNAENSDFFGEREVVVAKTSTQGGLNLFKWGAPQTTKATGWKAGDYMLHLPNKGTPA